MTLRTGIKKSEDTYIYVGKMKQQIITIAKFHMAKILPLMPSIKF
jgi:hypothetical protein